MLNSTTLGLDHTVVNDWNNHEDMNCYMYTAEQELLIRTNQAHQMDHGSWYRLCDKDCCAANGRWNGNY
ncbi:unnamed protein product [Adineta ricciae]|uniref:Uncharacterized protein n=1 Tax=Adineta ricciae TaxID=249248 RepID=A0A816HGX2_ADIRI|nr:unnamed protein product [Adineta ricciae]